MSFEVARKLSLIVVHFASYYMKYVMDVKRELRIRDVRVTLRMSIIK